MKKIIAFLVISLFLSLSSVSADDTGTGATGTGNTSPVANFDLANTTKNVPVVINVLSNDTDINGNSLIVTGTGNLLNGKASFTSTGVTFTPTTGFVGIGSFSYTISDNNGGTATGYVNVNVKNTSPVANNDSVSTTINVAKTINVLSNDTDFDGDTLEVIGTSNVLNGTTSFTSTGVTFTPTTGFLGTGSFSYTISDGNGGTDIGDVQLKIITTGDDDEEDEDDDNDEDNEDDDNDVYYNNGNKHKNYHGRKVNKNKYNNSNARPWSNANKKSKEERNEIKEKYKNRYGKMISNLDDEKAQTLVDKIDSLAESITAGTYSDDIKVKFIAILNALKEIILER